MGLAHMCSTLVRNPSTPSPFSRRIWRTLRYVDSYQVTNVGGGNGFQVWRLNSLFDPDFTGTGHQPLYFDQFCTSSGPYNNYVVVGVRLALIVAAINDGGPDVTISYAMGPASYSSTPVRSVSDVTQLAETPGWTTGMQSAYERSKTYKFQYDMAKLFGITQEQLLAEDDYMGVYNNNPTNQQFFHFAYTTLGAAAGEVQVTIMIEYDTVFRTLDANIGQS